ncbi:MAG: patatin-like phospholipase family protein [Bacillota bacterium]
MVERGRGKIGLALGSGAARGLAHIPVIETLENNGIRIDMIAGTSIGSLIGGVYATGVPIKYIKEIAKELNWDQITDITFPRKGLIKGDKLLAFLEVITQNKNIEDLKIPFRAIACDIENNRHITLNEGSVAKAIRASISIPGIYVPFFHQGKLLIDGGVLDPVPVSTLRKMGADIVIAVDVGVKNAHYKANNIFDILFSTFDIIQQEIDKYRSLDADIIIRPDLGDYNSFDLESYEKCFSAGYDAVNSVMPKIKDIIKERS